MENGLYDRIQKLCEERKISIARLEMEGHQYTRSR